jgi:hypothetical protein
MKTESLILIGISALISYMVFRKSKPRKQVISPIIDLEMEEYPLEEVPVSKPFRHGLRSHINPYEIHGFGIDTKRNVDEYEMETYLDLPLVGSGKTYSNESLAEIDSNSKESKPIVYKYYRLNVQETRDQTNTISIGAIEFYNGNEKVGKISIWDPHTGERSTYNGPWTSSQSKSLSLFFHDPSPINSYRIKTSGELCKNDPSIWTLEGSMNASYWVLLDNQDIELPVKREQYSEFIIHPVNISSN